MKKIKYILILVFAFSLGISNAKAYNSVKNDCVDRDECMLVCNYVQTMKSSGGNTKDRSISIYYYYDGNWQVSWETTSNDGFIYNTGAKSFSKAFKNVFHQSSLTESNFSCPKYGYIDVDGFNGGNEICLDNDVKFCKDSSNFATTFGKGDFISTEKDYDYNWQMERYFSEWITEDIPYEDIKNGVYKSSDDLYEKFENDFKVNFMNGKEVPYIITNSESYKNAVSTIRKKFDESYNEWKNESDELLSSGSINQEEYDEIITNIDNVSSDLEEKFEKELARINEIALKNLPIEEVTFCSDGVLTAFKIVGYIIYVLKMLIPLVLIIMGSIDFAKAIISTNEKPNTDVIKAFTMRIIIGVVIFLIPTVLSFLINLVDGATDLFEDSGFTSCTTCLLDPTHCNE